jgi:hypothetical protein
MIDFKGFYFICAHSVGTMSNPFFEKGEMSKKNRDPPNGVKEINPRGDGCPS